MLLRIACPTCSHTGIVSAERLPAELQCSRCGVRRLVVAKDCRRVASREAVLEWLCGAEAPPARGAVARVQQPGSRSR
jgi:hypothetical protein